MDNNLLLVAVISLLVVMAVMFFGTGVIRLATYDPDEEEFDQMLDSILESEVANEDSTMTPPEGIWALWWFKKAHKAGKVKEDVNAPGRVAIFAALFGAAIGLLATRHPLGLLLAGFVGIMAVNGYYTIAASSRTTKIAQQLPDLLSGLRANLQADQTPNQALLAQVDKMPEPFHSELVILRDDVNAGKSMDKSLAAMSQRIDSREVYFMIASIRIAMESGADLDAQLKIIQDIVSAKQRVNNKRRTAIAAVQPTLFISSLVIPIMYLWSYFFSGPDAQKYWGTFMGLIMTGVVAILYTVGLFISRYQANKIKDY